jgi:yecA family protein
VTVTKRMPASVPPVGPRCNVGRGSLTDPARPVESTAQCSVPYASVVTSWSLDRLIAQPLLVDTSMTAVRFKPRSSRLARDTPVLLPPDPRVPTATSFSADDFASLAKRLSQPGWPRGSMNLPMLKGYLTALLVWPVELPAGAWMPPIWGGSGWRVPQVIEDPRHYAEFSGLVVGLLRALERGLSTIPAEFASNPLGSPRREGRPISSPLDWANGFKAALALGGHGIEWRSRATHQAVRLIAACSFPQPATPSSSSRRQDALAQAVSVLAAERTSRGPLGRLEPRPRAIDRNSAQL